MLSSVGLVVCEECASLFEDPTTDKKFAPLEFLKKQHKNKQQRQKW
jgi:hypothetical protein